MLFDFDHRTAVTDHHLGHVTDDTLVPPDHALRAFTQLAIRRTASDSERSRASRNDNPGSPPR